MNTFKYLLLGSLFLASCSEQEEFKRPGETGGETIEVTQDIQVNVLPMQSIASPATRSAANGKPEKGEAVHLTYGGGGATTRVQTGSDPMNTDESKINNAYIVQFDGTAPTSKVAWVSGDIKSQLGSATPITCSFQMTQGKKNRVYVIANRASAPTQGMTLAEFEKPVPMNSYTLPVSGLPMSAMQDIGVGDAFDVFQLRSVLAKLTFTCDPSTAALTLINVPSGYSFLTQSQPGDKAVRPSGMTYDKTITSLTSGITYYVPENMSGRNEQLVQQVTRCSFFAPENAMFVKISNSGTDYNLYLGDGSAPDFNFTGGYAYNIKATIYGSDASDLRVGTPVVTDLNAGGKTANCYIAGADKLYMFNSTVMGNGAFTMANGAPNAADIIPSRLSPASADVLWETLNKGGNPDPTPTQGDIIKNIYFLKDYILFKSSNTEGNAVIAARDASGNIIWSWHIWRINAAPSAIPLKDITGSSSFTASGIKMMDRNLGALETPSTDPHTYLSMGFLYQWGRKDPFPNMAAFSSSGSWAKATNVDFSTDKSTTPASSVAMSIASPTKFYCGPSSPYDWCTARNDNYWGTPSTGNTVTIGNKSYDSNRGSKTIYDPCPPGWRVPAQYVYANAVGAIGGGFDHGFDFKGKLTSSASIFLPAAGSRNNSTGASGNQSIGGYYWASSVPSGSVGASNVYFNSATLNATSSSRANGFSVRCVQEQ